MLPSLASNEPAAQRTYIETSQVIRFRAAVLVAHDQLAVKSAEEAIVVMLVREAAQCAGSEKREREAQTHYQSTSSSRVHATSSRARLQSQTINLEKISLPSRTRHLLFLWGFLFRATAAAINGGNILRLCRSHADEVAAVVSAAATKRFLVAAAVEIVIECQLGA